MVIVINYKKILQMMTNNTQIPTRGINKAVDIWDCGDPNWTPMALNKIIKKRSIFTASTFIAQDTHLYSILQLRLDTK